jgi:hypothetical protein
MRNTSILAGNSYRLPTQSASLNRFLPGGMHMKKESEEAYRAQPIAFIQE